MPDIQGSFNGEHWSSKSRTGMAKQICNSNKAEGWTIQAYEEKLDPAKGRENESTYESHRKEKETIAGITHFSPLSLSPFFLFVFCSGTCF